VQFYRAKCDVEILKYVTTWRPFGGLIFSPMLLELSYIQQAIEVEVPISDSCPHHGCLE